MLHPALIPLLRRPDLEISREWLALLDETSSSEELSAATVTEKKRPVRWQDNRSLLVNLLDTIDVLQLPPRRDSGSSRFLNTREFALVSLLLGIGALDHSKTVAEVIAAEAERMRITIRRHGRPDSPLFADAGPDDAVEVPPPRGPG